MACIGHIEGGEVLTGWNHRILFVVCSFVVAGFSYNWYTPHHKGFYKDKQMNKNLSGLFKKYIRSISILTGVIGILIGVMFIYLPQYLSPALLWLIPYFLVISLGFHYYLIKSATKDVKKFIPRFMVSTGVKLVVYLGTLLVMAFTSNNNPVPFIIGFFTLYLFYTIFEIVSFMHQSKQIQN